MNSITDDLFRGESYSSENSVLFGAFAVIAPYVNQQHFSKVSINKISPFPPASESVDPYIWVYFGISLLYTFISLVNQFILAIGTIKAAQSIFRKSLTRVVGATSRYFDVTPVRQLSELSECSLTYLFSQLGRILNRFSSDMETIDYRLSMSVTQTVETTMLVARYFSFREFADAFA